MAQSESPQSQTPFLHAGKSFHKAEGAATKEDQGKYPVAAPGTVNTALQGQDGQSLEFNGHMGL